MANRLLKLARVTYTPGVAATPAAKAYSYVVTTPIAVRQTDIWRQAYMTYASQQGVPLNRDRSGEFGQFLNATMGTGPTAAGAFNAVTTRTVNVPARPGTPAVPARVTQTSKSGWNGGGRSIARIPNNGFASFKLGPFNIGALVGLSGPVDSLNFSEATHAIYQVSGAYQIVERGVVVATITGVQAGDTFLLERINGVVTYSVSSGFKYVSALPSSGPLCLDALLYSPDDYVDSPVIGFYVSAIATGSLSLNAAYSVRPRAKDGIRFSGSVVARQGVNAFGRAAGTFELQGQAIGSMTNAGSAAGLLSFEGSVLEKTSDSVVRGPRLGTASSENGYARSKARHGGWVMRSEGGAPVLTTAAAIAFEAPAIMQSYGITGGVGGSQVAGLFDAYSIDENLTDGQGWGRSKAVGIGHFMLSGTDPYHIEDFTTREALVFQVGDETNWPLNVQYEEMLQINESIELWMLLDASIAELLLLNTSHDAVFDLDLFTEESVLLSTAPSTAGAGGIQVAVNAETAASTLYQGFDFMRIISPSSGAYGVRADGVYLIEQGRGDSGAVFDGVVDLGSVKYKEISTSRIRAVFIDGDIDGDVRLQLTADDGIAREYEVVDRDHVLRAVPAKGVESRMWRVRVMLRGVKQGEMAAVRFDGGNKTRSWVRR